MTWKKCFGETQYKSGGSAVYGLGLVGALIYFLQNATTLWEGILGLFKALVWPAVLVYKLLELLI